MGLFDFLKEKSVEKQPTIKTKSLFKANRLGKAVAAQIEVDASNASLLRKEFIAFDIETTGLSSITDRIVEIGAVLFIDGSPAKSFSTLINPKVKISASASAVNHITNTMLSSAPLEQNVYPQLIEFLGEAINGNTIMCAHNARFDFDFLCNTLSRLGYDADIQYVDTLSLSRRYVKGLENYKQCTVESFFNLTNNAAHRAESDAEICGKILCRILERVDEVLEEEESKIEMTAPTKEELEVCAYIQSIIQKKHADVSWLRYRKNSNSYVDVSCLYSLLKFKFAKKGKYIIIEKNVAHGIGLPIEACTESEGGTKYSRVYFNSPFDLEPLSKYIFGIYSDCYRSMQEYIGNNNYCKSNAEQSIKMAKAISSVEMESLLLDAETREYNPTATEVQVELIISREDVIVNAIHSRISLCEIRNLGNWEKGFDAGHPYWVRGETARKNGLVEEAISLFDKARHNGYDAPALYDSYAKFYRQIKDYDNEILILEEAIERMSNSKSDIFEARRDKAIKLLFTQQEAERKAKEKTQAKENNVAQKVKEKETTVFEPKQPRGRSIIQMTDDGTVIKEFETIASAVNEVGINSKSIRDAAKGVQKHAGGYCWKYKD